MRTARLATACGILAAAVTAASAREISASAAFGLFRGVESAYRQVYGPSPAFSLELALRVKGRLGLATGFGRVFDRGTAVVVTGAGDGEAYRVDIRRSTVPLIVFYALRLGRLEVRAGAGMGLHSYSEEWADEGLRFSGTKLSARLLLSAGVDVAPRIALLGMVLYDDIPTGAGSLLAPEVNLGGWQIAGGLAVRIR